MLVLIIGLVVFHGIHSLRMVAPAWRDAKIEAMGIGKWKGIYSLVSLVAFILLVYGYGQARAEASILYDPPIWTRHIAYPLMLVSFVFAAFNMRSSRFRALTHHPFLVAIILWSVAHLLANGDTASVLLFGSFLIWALFNYRFVRRRPTDLPPVAPLKVDLMVIAASVLLWLVFFLVLHEWLIGVRPY